MSSKLRPPLGPDDHVLGSERAPVTMVEFGDYECPFCGEAAPIVASLRETLGERLRFGFRHFPLTTMHPHALLAAQAAEAAGAQQRFWQMHERLYAMQDALELPDLIEHAVALGLDLDRFAADLKAGRYIDKIRADLHSGALSGVNGTPSFFINGLRYDGAWDFDSLFVAITRASTGAEAPPEPLLP